MLVFGYQDMVTDLNSDAISILYTSLLISVT